MPLTQDTPANAPGMDRALERAKSHLIDEAEMYERDAVFLATLRD